MFVMILLMKRISPAVRGTVAAGLLATGGMGMFLTPGATDASVAKNADPGISKTARDAIACVVKVKDGDTLSDITNDLHVGKGNVVDARDSQDRPLASLGREVDDSLGEAVPQIQENDRITVVADEAACIALADTKVVPIHIAPDQVDALARTMSEIGASEAHAAEN